jgi:hypothetical protein
MKDWKWYGMLLVALPVGLYTAFVAECYWNWFAVPALNVQSISFLQMLGLVWLIQLLFDRSPDDEPRWKLMVQTLELCVPDEKKEALSNIVGDFDVALAGFLQVARKLVGNTLALAMGFALHLISS